MTSRPPGALRTSAGSALAFTLAALIGRQAVLPGTELALVWPAAGIAAVWIAAHAGTRWVAIDCALLGVASAAVNAVTGTSLLLAAAIGLSSVVQALVLAALLARWAPDLHGFADRPPDGLGGVRAFGALLAASTVACLASALVGPATILALRDQDWAVVASWVVRNTTGVLAVFPLALAFPHLVRRGPGAALEAVRGRRLEALALFVATAVGVWVVFDLSRDLPLPFVLLTACVWAGTRFGPVPAALHAVLLSAAVVVLAVWDRSSFATVEDGYHRALVVQTYVLVVVLVTVILSVARRESVLLTERLVASEQAATDQARLMLTIVDSMTDGVSVLDHEGRLLLRNPSASRLVGDPQLDADGVVQTAGYGILGLDGQPVPAEESPFTRALAGDEAVHAEYLLRGPASGERRLEVTATPVGDDAPELVVLVYHDVTAERREREELAAFAGVVAHDLLNPISTIEGWTMLMEEDAAAGTVDAASQLRYLQRISSASTRMHALIDDLLAYTTARDLAIEPEPVDTTTLVRDIAQSRVEAAGAGGGEARVVLGDLPAVLGEPVLLRQAVDNLVGNAIKYVAPGVTPLVEISGRLVDSPAGFVELTVADNGIGIPAGQHASVFETFHRAHRDGYRGTGLGLSIVKRVAERHGGSVVATDRPGGGTAITLLLPAAGDRVSP